MDKEFLHSDDDFNLRRRLVARLRSGEVLMLPSDTIYGLSCRADNLRAIKKIFAIKKRDKNKPLIILVSSLQMARKYCFINSKQAEILQKTWSGSRPTSVLLKHRGILPKEISISSPYLAVRLPKSDFLRKMIRVLAVPLISTSANLSGQKVLDGTLAWKKFKKEPRPDLILFGGKNSKLASKLLLLNNDGSQEVLRK
ncbi:MAG: L-threonylcarbamoyladenylate synthase [Patescibacteria group bacterium]|nr:L-threonylcarbamoyladenylate synthase [Patescibacteria group bacterium]